MWGREGEETVILGYTSHLLAFGHETAMKFEDWKTLAETLQAVVTIVAIVLGGIWTYILFVKKREKYPRARTVHRIVTLGSVNGRWVIRILVRIENIGSVLLCLDEGEVVVQNLFPLPPEWGDKLKDGLQLERKEFEYDWPSLDKFLLEWGDKGYIIEPQESDEFHFDLHVDSSVQRVQVYSYVKNLTQKKREVGWNCTTIHSLPGGLDGSDKVEQR
jgi:hypothetical protein